MCTPVSKTMLVLAPLLVCAGPALAQDQPTQLKFLEVGGQTVLKMHNPAEPGRRWRFNAARSFQVDNVELKELRGVPALYQMRVEAKEAGFVVLAFEVVAAGAAATSPKTAEFGIKIEPEGPTIVKSRRGQTHTAGFLGTPGGGYAWKLNKEQSKGLDLVGIEDLGWSALVVPGISEQLTGGPAVQRFQVKSNKPGKALLVFDYARPWETKPPARQKIIDITIAE